jgi:uncharacterized membrane protein
LSFFSQIQANAWRKPSRWNRIGKTISLLKRYNTHLCGAIMSQSEFKSESEPETRSASGPDTVTEAKLESRPGLESGLAPVPAPETNFEVSSVDAIKPSAAKTTWGVASHGESRWPASMALVIAMFFYLMLPDRYTLGPNWLMPALELSILVPVSFGAPVRKANEVRLKTAAIAMIALVNIANLFSLILLVHILLYHGKDVTGPELLFSSLGIWFTNVIVFSLWYWEIDRGGPDQRLDGGQSRPDFLFPQMSSPGCSYPDWTPRFFDYLYIAFTNATAFSPTDVLPLTKSAKALMLAQSIISLVTITLVAARAVNILS